MNVKSLSMALLASLSVAQTHVDTIYGCSLYDNTQFCNHNDKDLMIGAAKEGWCCDTTDESADCQSDLKSGLVCGGKSYADAGELFWFNSPDSDESLCGSDDQIILFDSLNAQDFTIDGPIFDSTISKVQNCPYYLQLGNYIISHSDADLSVTVTIGYSYNGDFYAYDVTDLSTITPLSDGLPLVEGDSLTMSVDQSYMLMWLPYDNGVESSATWSAAVNGQVDTSFVDPSNWETYLVELQTSLDTAQTDLETAIADAQDRGLFKQPRKAAAVLVIIILTALLWACWTSRRDSEKVTPMQGHDRMETKEGSNKSIAGHTTQTLNDKSQDN